MNKAFSWRLGFLGFLLLFVAQAAGETVLLEWQGRTPLTALAYHEPLRGQVLPEVVPSTLGGGGSDLLFKVDDRKTSRGRQFIDLSLPAGASLPQATISCYVYPERKRLSEDLLSALAPEAVEGFRLRHSWGILFFEFGDGHEKLQFKVDYKNQRNVLLDFGSWQHVAVVFDEGTVRIYKNGRLILEKESGLATLAIGRVPLRLGAHPGSAPATYPFQGRITGIAILETALTSDEIFNLMERTFR